MISTLSSVWPFLVSSRLMLGGLHECDSNVKGTPLMGQEGTMPPSGMSAPSMRLMADRLDAFSSPWLPEGSHTLR